MRDGTPGYTREDYVRKCQMAFTLAYLSTLRRSLRRTSYT
jgi:hypothetical protein